MASIDDEELEYTLLNKREVLVYQIPPASSSSGHKADDWKKCIWRGRCQVAGKGSNLAIKLLDASSGNLFAQCMIPNGEHDKYVERVVDSSRYFVLKITNGARHAFIGLGFEDRNDAFDFNCTLSDFKSTWVDRGGQVPEGEAPPPAEPAKDLSLKEGQKITINIGGLGTRSRRREEQAEQGGDGGSFLGLLAPPPPGGASRKQPAAPFAAPPAAPAPMAAPVAAPAAADFDEFDDFQSSPAPAPQMAPPAAAAPMMAAPAPTVAPAPAMDGLAAQLGSLGFDAPKSAPAPAAAPMGAPAAVAPQQPAFPAFQQPMQQPQQPANMYVAPAAPQSPQQQTPTPAPFDPFGGFGGLGGPAAAPAAPAPAADEFDIFK
eukprot:CAMPEP_0176081156 /NCGR_PEP_ID=MMETSP0120_2-20121206/40596_1 /TAXON_ID=160619 /ORGANISM="Kryptoperidinium foliaceum, Strain CCMP 1326" /LENGTH=374 /DNA_ID=CAMNT_0017414925 /DNA_START=97 /DNA_END=1221 /DNA_ORIENTATION=+